MTTNWIALYGSLMQGLGAMDELELDTRLEFKGPAVIRGDLFDLGSFPGLRHGEGRVRAELYAILEADALIQLDQFEGVIAGCPAESLYLRERIQLIEPSGTEAWVYLYNRSPSEDKRIVGGDWRAYLKER